MSVNSKIIKDQKQEKISQTFCQECYSGVYDWRILLVDQLESNSRYFRQKRFSSQHKLDCFTIAFSKTEVLLPNQI